MPKQGPRRASNDAENEIEITPEMMEAGIEEYALFDFQEPGEWVVSAIYRAMAKAERDHRKSALDLDSLTVSSRP